jgi:hypothetical protein
MIEATVLRVPSEAFCGSAKRYFLAEGDCADVFHRAGGEIGNSEMSSLPNGYLMPVHSL